MLLSYNIARKFGLRWYLCKTETFAQYDLLKFGLLQEFVRLSLDNLCKCGYSFFCLNFIQPTLSFSEIQINFQLLLITLLQGNWKNFLHNCLIWCDSGSRHISGSLVLMPLLIQNCHFILQYIFLWAANCRLVEISLRSFSFLFRCLPFANPFSQLFNLRLNSINVTLINLFYPLLISVDWLFGHTNYLLLIIFWATHLIY